MPKGGASVQVVGGPAHALVWLLCGYSRATFVATQLNRGLLLGMAGRRSGDTRISCGRPDTRPRHWEWCAYGQVPSKVGTV